MVVTINGEELEVKLSAFSMVLYEQEFGSDLIGDLNGKVKVDDGEEEGVLFDFTKIPWMKILQGIWAMLKTAKPSTPHFEKWVKGVEEFNAFEMRNVLEQAVSDNFFHTAAPAEEGK